jgi:hypothetical protein
MVGDATNQGVANGLRRIVWVRIGNVHSELKLCSLVETIIGLHHNSEIHQIVRVGEVNFDTGRGFGVHFRDVCRNGKGSV